MNNKVYNPITSIHLDKTNDGTSNYRLYIFRKQEPTLSFRVITITAASNLALRLVNELGFTSTAYIGPNEVTAIYNKD